MNVQNAFITKLNIPQNKRHLSNRKQTGIVIPGSERWTMCGGVQRQDAAGHCSNIVHNNS